MSIQTFNNVDAKKLAYPFWMQIKMVLTGGYQGIQADMKIIKIF